MMLAAAHALLVAMVSLTAAGRQGIDDPALRAAVERFFAMQQAEDVDGYLSLWSTKAKRPDPGQLKYVFDAGDDTFSDVAITNTFPTADRVRVRVSATRDRVTPSRIPGRPPFTSHSTTTWSLVYVREGSEWRLVREGVGRRRPGGQPDRGARPGGARATPAGRTRTGHERARHRALAARGAVGADADVRRRAGGVRAHA